MSHRETEPNVQNAISSHSQRVNEIDALYKSQIKKMYEETKVAVQEGQFHQNHKPNLHDPNSNQTSNTLKKVVSSKNFTNGLGSKQEPQISTDEFDLDIENKLNILSLASPVEQSSVRASTFLQGESTRTIEILRRENETKEMKIRELTNRCENLIEKLQGYLTPQQLQIEMESVKKFSDRNMQRLESLFKIKNEQIFFKIKLQITKLLQDFEVPKEEISGMNQVSDETQLFEFMVRKLKFKLKDFRSQEQKSQLKNQKEKIVNEKHEERIHYLTETTELLKLSETKLKNKIEDLRGQLSEYIDKIKQKETEVEEKENEIFRLKKQNEDLQSVNKKIVQNQKYASSERVDEKRIIEAKQKEMKSLLASYFMEKKQLENLLEDKEGEIQEILIRVKYLEVENERLNREYVRWKERYEWIEKEKENRQKEFQEEKNTLLSEFENYKSGNNEGVYLACKGETEEALKKVEEYQVAYDNLAIDLHRAKENYEIREQEVRKTYEQSEKQLLEKMGRLERIKQEEIMQIISDQENREKELKMEFERREQLMSSEIQAKMKALIASSEKKATIKAMQLQAEKDELLKQNEHLKKIAALKMPVKGDGN